MKLADEGSKTAARIFNFGWMLLGWGKISIFSSVVNIRSPHGRQRLHGCGGVRGLAGRALLLASVARERVLRYGLRVAVFGGEIIQQELLILYLGAPAGHLIQFFAPGHSRQTLRVNEAQAVTRYAVALLFLLGCFDIYVRCEYRGHQYRRGNNYPVLCHADFSTVIPTRSTALYKYPEGFHSATKGCTLPAESVARDRMV